MRVNINDVNLTLDDMPTNWGEGVYLFYGIPFTGIIYEYFPNTTQLSSENEYKEGVPNGRQAEYWPNGQLKSEYFQKYDFTISSFKQWNDQSVLISHTEYDDFGNFIKKII